MTQYVAAGVVRTTLQAVRAISGRNYVRLLEASGLERYREQLPASDNRPELTAEEYSRLPAAVYALLGEALTRLFLRNAGMASLERIWRDPQVQALFSGGGGRPPDDKLAWFVTAWAPLIERTWSPVRVREDATAWYITIVTCPICGGLRGVSAPICTIAEALYSGMAAKVVGRRVLVSEVECAAMGAAHCTYAFYK